MAFNIDAFSSDGGTGFRVQLWLSAATLSSEEQLLLQQQLEARGQEHADALIAKAVRIFVKLDAERQAELIGALSDPATLEAAAVMVAAANMVAPEGAVEKENA